MRVLRAFVKGVVWLVVSLATAWSLAALWVDSRSAMTRWLALLAALLVLLTGLVLAKGLGKKLAVLAALSAVVITWWLVCLEPTDNRPWQPDVSRKASVYRTGGHYTFENVRNCDYRAEFDYTCEWGVRTVDIENLRGLDIFLDNWGSPWIAHPIMSFDFGPQGRIPFSIETRKAKGQSYSALLGFFRQYELIIVVSDERDVVRLRTNYRKDENLYVYHTKSTPEMAREILDGYVERINELNKNPEWYNALTNNCTTNIYESKKLKARPWDYRVLLNGKGDEMEYENGDLVTGGLSFAALKSQAWINVAAKAANRAPDFSEQIRAGRVGFRPMDRPDYDPERFRQVMSEIP